MTDLSEPRPRNAILMWVGILGAALCAMAIGFYALDRMSTPDIRGELLVRSHGGVFTLRPNSCSSLLRGDDSRHTGPGQAGVDLFDAEVPERRVRIIEDPALGMVVTVHSPKGMTPVPRSACERFDVSLKRTGKQIYGVWGLEGSAAFQCDDLQGEVVFSSCY